MSEAGPQREVQGDRGDSAAVEEGLQGREEEGSDPMEVEGVPETEHEANYLMNTVRRLVGSFTSMFEESFSEKEKVSEKVKECREYMEGLAAQDTWPSVVSYLLIGRGDVVRGREKQFAKEISPNVVMLCYLMAEHDLCLKDYEQADPEDVDVFSGLTPFRSAVARYLKEMECEPAVAREEIRNKQLEFFDAQIFGKLTPTSSMRAKSRYLKLSKEMRFITGGYRYGDRMEGLSFGRGHHEHIPPLAEMVKAVCVFAAKVEVRHGLGRVTEAEKKDTLKEVVSQVVLKETVSEGGKNRCIYFDKNNLRASITFTPMTRDEYAACFGEKGVLLEEHFKALREKGFLDVSRGMTAEEDAEPMGEEDFQVIHKRLEEDGKYCGDVVLLKNCLSRTFRDDVISKTDEARYIPRMQVGNSHVKDRATRVVGHPDEKSKDAVFILGNDKVPVALDKRASMSEEFAMQIITYLFRTVEEELVVPKCPNGKHYERFLEESCMLYNSVSKVKHSNGLHSDASIHHCHTKMWERAEGGVDEEGEVLPVDVESVPEKEVLYVPRVDTMRVGTVCLLEALGGRDLSQE